MVLYLLGGLFSPCAAKNNLQELGQLREPHALLQRQIFREQAVSRVNLTRFGETSVVLEHKEEAIQRLALAAIALDLQ